MQTQIYDVDYNDCVSLVGTAHFTERSLHDAYQAVKRLQPTDLAVELDLKRFRILNTACWTCPRQGTCATKCEFIGATEALGNVDANIWLIDMSEHEIRQRIRMLTTPTWALWVGLPIFFQEDQITGLWEQGFKDEVIDIYRRRLKRLRERAPAVWRVLIDERNAIMAARLAWIVSEKLRENMKPNILTFTGAAHVEGIKELLGNPITIRENLQRFSLTFSPPTLIKRISVSAD